MVAPCVDVLPAAGADDDDDDDDDDGAVRS